MHRNARKIIDLLQNDHIRGRANRVILTLSNDFENLC